MARALQSCACAQSAQKGEGGIRFLLSVALVHRRYAPRRTLGHWSLLLPPCCPLANYQVILSSFKLVPSLLSRGRWKSDTFSFYWSLPLFFTPPIGLSSKNMYTSFLSDNPSLLASVPLNNGPTLQPGSEDLPGFGNY